MKTVMQVGKPTHFRPGNRNLTACGIVGATHAAYDPRDVDCLMCVRTKVWKQRMFGKDLETTK